MAATIAWPFTLFSGEAGFHLVSSSIQPEQSLSGLRPVLGTAVQLWRFRMNMNTLKPESVRSYRAALAEGRGPQQVYRIPVVDQYEPKPNADGLPGENVTFHSNGAPFSNGAGYLHQGEEIKATCVRGARSFVADETTRAFVTRGAYFGLGQDMHVCTRVEGNRVYFEPAARRNHTNVDISLRPSISARLIDENQGADLYGDNKFVAPTLEWIEAPF